MTTDAIVPASRQFDEHVLDDNTLDELASIICGDDGPRYRKGWELEGLLRNAGWTDFDSYDGGPRKGWLVGQLRAHKMKPHTIATLIRRLADSREYLSETVAAVETVRQLNELLAHEGFRIRLVHGRGEVIDTTAAEVPEYEAPIQLTASLTTLIHNPVAASALQRRLDETLACQEGGAHMSAVIMMGSLLEGVLVEVLRQRGALPSTGDRTPLHQLIVTAHRLGYIRDDVEAFSQALRDFRNLVHVHSQMRTGKAPDGDTARVCWWVVVAALNKLDASEPR